MQHAVHRVGHGPHAVLVLHGWFGDAHSFEALEPWLTQDAFSYVFMDYRGYGSRRDIPGAFSIDEIAGDALTLADALGWSSFSLIGHSMGGMAAERIATLAPQRVRALVAIAPVPCGGVTYDAAARQVLQAAASQPALRRTIIARSTAHRLPPSWVEWKADYSEQCSRSEAFAAYFQAWADTDFSTAISSGHPLKVLIGEYDPVFNRDLMERTYLRRYRDASMEVIANAGHYPMNETPLALVRAIESFLAERAPLAVQNKYSAE